MASYVPLQGEDKGALKPIATGAQALNGNGQGINATAPGQPAPTGQSAPDAQAQAGDPGQPTGGTMPAQGQGTGFINLQNVLAANGPAGKNMASDLSWKASQMGQYAQNEATGKSPTEGMGNTDDAQIAAGEAAKGYGMTGDKTKDAQTAQDYANSLGSYAGLQSTLQKQYAGQAYTPGQAGLDAFLTQTAGGQDFQQAQSAYGNLTQQLQNYDSGQRGAAEKAATKGSSSMNDGQMRGLPAPVYSTPQQTPAPQAPKRKKAHGK